ncbi:cytochrome oxidase c subunit VIb-domain-containing protein [Spinellus fusiger]|nr:cytochrome oxidase c subunit VIb-domain-containing protein [Spinellus fusiger]
MSAASAEGSKPPTRQERKVCWKLRDEYFSCLDRLNILDPATVDKDPSKAQTCLDSKQKYEDGCMASWVEYFNKRRVIDIQQKKYLEFSEKMSGK